LVESNQHIQKQLKIAKVEAEKVKEELISLQLFKLAKEVDIIARDIESKMVQFSVEDPIDAVLSSYTLIHKIANINEEPTINVQEILSIADNEDLTEKEIIQEIKNRVLGLPLDDIKNILYILEKDYNLLIPLEKIATPNKRKIIPEAKTQDDKEHNKEIIEEIIEGYRDERKKTKKDEGKWYQSFPSAPSTWSGFSYQTPIPYQQSNALNFWSLASEEDQEILQKIAKTQK